MKPTLSIAAALGIVLASAAEVKMRQSTAAEVA
jgi:hypothetical protein